MEKCFLWVTPQLESSPIKRQRLLHWKQCRALAGEKNDDQEYRCQSQPDFPPGFSAAIILAVGFALSPCRYQCICIF